MTKRSTTCHRILLNILSWSADDFKTFTANPGKYPITSGYKGTVEPKPKPEPCVASYLLGANDPRLDKLRIIGMRNWQHARQAET